MVMSIVHRITGIMLAGGTLLLVWWLVALAMGPVAYGRAQNFISSPIGILMMFGWTVALFYHLANGIRHLFWDAGLRLRHSDGVSLGLRGARLDGAAHIASWLIAGVVALTQ
jgi:succinate dehydrogenase / fumarate reductase cytochrome b subunit